MDDFHPSTWKVYVHGFASLHDIDVDIGELLWMSFVITLS